MENIREDTLLGSRKVIVGNNQSDIILETLGKVYIKSGRNCKLLDDVIKEFIALSQQPQEEVKSKTIIVDSVSDLDNLDYPGDGYLIYTSNDNSLYITYGNQYIALIQASSNITGDYVKKEGDVMSGQLEITPTTVPPLIIRSKELVENLNAEFLRGYSGEDFAKRREKETISGDWIFTGNNISRANWRFYKDIILDGSISSPFFSSGFEGSGWRIDAKTNTLTIDYLVVRKAMQVYELVVNKITATNGSLWISNASKVSDRWKVLETSSIDFIKDLNNKYVNATGNTFTVLDEISRSILTRMLVEQKDIIFTDILANVMTVSGAIGNYTFPSVLTHIVDASALVSSPLFTDISQLWSTEFLDKINLELINGESPVPEWGSEEFKSIQRSASGIKMFEFDTVMSSMEIVSEDNKQIITKPIYFTYFFNLQTEPIKGDFAPSDWAGDFFTSKSSSSQDNFFIVNFEREEYPVFKSGDLLRCQKYQNQVIKYYDAIVLKQIDTYSFVVQLAPSVLDKYTEISYGSDGSITTLTEEYNEDLYKLSVYPEDKITVEINEEEVVLGDPLGSISIGDSLVQMGNVSPQSKRQNAIYLTSTDDQGPYINILSDLNRPDYSVLYKIPKLDENGDYIIDDDGNYSSEYTRTVKVRIGNLAGIVDHTFPADKQPRGYGLYGQNVFLTGEFYLNNGVSVVEFSQRGIFLRYKDAGLDIKDDPVTGDPMIILDANKVLIGDADSQIGSLFTVENGKAYIRTDFIKAQTIEVEEIYNYSFDTTTKSKTTTFAGTFLSPLYNGTAPYPYSLAVKNSWAGTLSSTGGSGVFKNTTTYPGTLAVMDSVDNERVHILAPIIDLRNGNWDGKMSKATITVNVGSFSTAGYQYLEAWVYNPITQTHYDLPLISSTGGQNVYSLDGIDSVTATNDVYAGISIIPTSSSRIILPVVSLNAVIEYVEGSLNWGLFKDGTGSLGRESIEWDAAGNLTVSGTFETNKSGRKIKLQYNTTTNNPEIALSDANVEVTKISYSTYNPNTSGTYSSGYIRLTESSSSGYSNLLTSRLLSLTSSSGYVDINAEETSIHKNNSHMYISATRLLSETIVPGFTTEYRVESPTVTLLLGAGLTIGARFTPDGNWAGKRFDGEVFSQTRTRSIVTDTAVVLQTRTINTTVSSPAGMLQTYVNSDTGWTNVKAL